MIRAGTAGAVLRLAVPRPPAPRAEVERMVDGELAGAAAETLARMRREPGRASKAVGGLLRARRELNSGRRRLLGDLLYEALRRDRTLDVLLQRAGRSTPLERWQGALVFLGGLPARALPWDADALADPLHALTGWALEVAPDPAEALSVAASLPRWFAARLLDEYAGRGGPERGTEEDGEALDLLGDLAEPVLLARALDDRATLTLQAQRPLGDRDALIAELDAAGVSVLPGRWSPDALRLEQRVDVNSLACVREGRAIVQDEGSRVIADLVGARPGELVVDACAGAGGKSLALLSAMEGRGRLLAADPRTDALAEARKRARRVGIDALHTVPLPERGPLPPALAAAVGRADRVLVDAPCTGSGALRRTPGARWARGPQHVARLAQTQQALLRRFAPLVRPGGLLVYATCSLFRAENEEVVDAFLAQDARFRPVPPRELLGEERAAHLADGDAVRLLPHRHGTDGFYAVALRRG